jgi:DNA primase
MNAIAFAMATGAVGNGREAAARQVRLQIAPRFETYLCTKGCTLDELPPQTRRLLTLLANWVTAQCAARDETREAFRFTRRDVRAATSWGDTQLKIHLSRLVELEYVIAHRGRNGTFEYELLYSGADDGKPHLCGLLDPEKLTIDGSRSGQGADRSGSGRASVGARWDLQNTPQSHAYQGEAVEPVGTRRHAVNHANVAPLLAATVREG